MTRFKQISIILNLVFFFFTLSFNSKIIALNKHDHLNVCSDRIFKKDYCFNLEVANDKETHKRGLMFREDIPQDGGMIFIFERMGWYPFWMKNTPTSLDIIWLDNNKKVVHIEKSTKPYSESSIAPNDEYALYVIELLAGSADKIHLKVGDKFKFN